MIAFKLSHACIPFLCLTQMSFEKADAESRNLSDLTDRQRQTLEEWVEKFTNGRKYPVVGKLID
jgi:hypothetical protein